MSGVPGKGGPPPKRDDQRRRRNKDTDPAETVQASGLVEAPELGIDAHPIAADWYYSLARSAQSRFYEPSDWQLARLVAQLLTDYFNGGTAAVLAEARRGMNELLTSEAERRRLRVEIERADQAPAEDPKVAMLNEYRNAANS